MSRKGVTHYSSIASSRDAYAVIFVTEAEPKRDAPAIELDV